MVTSISDRTPKGWCPDDYLGMWHTDRYAHFLAFSTRSSATAPPLQLVTVMKTLLGPISGAAAILMRRDHSVLNRWLLMAKARLLVCQFAA